MTRSGPRAVSCTEPVNPPSPLCSVPRLHAWPRSPGGYSAPGSVRKSDTKLRYLEPVHIRPSPCLPQRNLKSA